MSDRYVFGLIDPRDHRIFHVGTLSREVGLNEHVADVVAGIGGLHDFRLRPLLKKSVIAPVLSLRQLVLDSLKRSSVFRRNLGCGDGLR